MNDLIQQGRRLRWSDYQRRHHYTDAELHPLNPRETRPRATRSTENLLDINRYSDQRTPAKILTLASGIRAGIAHPLERDREVRFNREESR
jgi:hypothetical protein